MGYALMYGNCIICNNAFMFNSMKVPSTSIVTGTREPICEHCASMINSKRREKGMSEYPLEGAYEACPEEELSYSDD